MVARSEDVRVAFCVLEDGGVGFLAYGDGTVRVYQDADHIDPRLTLGDPVYEEVRTVERMRALVARHFLHPTIRTEVLVRLGVAKRVFGDYKFDE